MDREPHHSLDPQERATRLANEMLEALERSPEYDEEVRAIAFVYPNIGRGGIGLHGYEDTVERVVADALQSVQALLQSVGKDLATFEVPIGGQG